ncbi:MAG: tyrosine-type recombinase/integrase [Desulfobacterales bacterium]|nr:tyrosine-type recombinase/integrase [Desulfobacterales bacterium]
MQSNIYIFKTGDNYYKVGVSNHVEGRLATLQTGCPTEISIIKKYPADFPFEAELTIQKSLKDIPQRGEWYLIEDNESDFIKIVEKSIHAVERKTRVAIHADYTSKHSEEFASTLHADGKSPSTIDSYVCWAENLSKFVSKEMDSISQQDAINYLEHIHKTMAFNTYKQASYALSHYFKIVLKTPLEEAQFISKRPSERIQSLPEYITRSDAIQLIEALNGHIKIIASLIYGSGITLTECLNLRSRDIDFDNKQVLLRTSRKAVARKTFLPSAILEEFKIHFAKEKKRYTSSTTIKLASTECLKPIPPVEELESWDYQFVFSSRKARFDRNLNTLTTTHLDIGSFQKVIKKVSSMIGLEKIVTASILRHSFAVHMLQRGTDIESLRNILGHKDIKSTKIYLQLVNTKPVIPVGPLDW